MTRTVDPVCGMPLGEWEGVLLQLGAQSLRSCSEFCKQQFQRHPSAYAATPPAESPRVFAWSERRVAYVSREIALASGIPTHSGGLGVLVGDTLRAGSDLEVPMVGVTLVHRSGYFQQALERGQQIERDATWQPERQLQPLEARATVELSEPFRVVLMRPCTSLNASFFNTHRMLHQYLAQAYALGSAGAAQLEE